MKRPILATLLSFYLGAGAFRAISRAFDGRLWPFQGAETVIDILHLLSAVAAGVAAEGLWRMRRWTFQAFLAFAALMVATVVIQQTLFSVWTREILAVVVVQAAVFVGLAFGARSLVARADDEEADRPVGGPPGGGRGGPRAQESLGAPATQDPSAPLRAPETANGGQRPRADRRPLTYGEALLVDHDAPAAERGRRP